MPAEIAMFEIDSGRSIGFGGEPHFDLARLREVGHVLPFAVYLPGQDHSIWWVPNEDRAPGALRAIDLLRVASAAGARLDNLFPHRHLADVVGAGPPRVHLFGEDAKRAFCAR